MDYILYSIFIFYFIYINYYIYIHLESLVKSISKSIFHRSSEKGRGVIFSVAALGH